MRRIISGALVVTGDAGDTPQRVDVELAGRNVVRIGGDVARDDADIIDGEGMVVLPGLVNVHAHGVTPGPLMPSGGAPLPRERWLENLDRNLRQGTTAVLSLCGLATMDHVNIADRSHPVHVRGATTHEPNALLAAYAADGAGVDASVSATSVAEQLAKGAIAIGELGGGQTLAGGGQDVVYLPRAIAERHGARITADQARMMKEAVIGRGLEWVDDQDMDAAVRRVVAAFAPGGIPGGLAAEELVQVVREVVVPSLRPALLGIREGLRLAAQHGVPAFVHSAAVTRGMLLELFQTPIRARIVACHVNHPSYLPEEAADLVLRGRSAGWVNEADVLDLLDARRMVTTREHWDAVFETGAIDLIATDYGPDGAHDGLLHGVRDLVARGVCSLGEAVAMVTSAPADLVPGITPTRGRLMAGGEADLVIAARDDVAMVRDVLIGGEVVVAQGRTVRR